MAAEGFPASIAVPVHPSQEPGSTLESGVSSVFASGSEMGRLCRETDWAKTPLGPVQDWPQSLRTTVALVLGSGFPMILVWGSELIQIYNDAYIPLIGQKHPGALAMPAHACWPEIWHLQEPLFEGVFNGKTVDVVEAHYPLERNGKLEGLYFDATFVPVPLESGKIGGSVSTLSDVNARVTARALGIEREKAETALRESEARYQRIAANVPGVVYQFMLRPDGSAGFPFASEGARAIFGCDPEELREDATPGMERTIHPEDRPGFDQSVAESAASLLPWVWEGRLVHRSGEVRWIRATSRPERQEDGSTLWDGLVLDITDRKRDEQRLLESGREKEVLLREIHHRVKNNLQIISSLLSLQARAVKDEEAAGVIRDSQMRVRSMAMVHETLYRSANLARVDFGEYIRVLGRQLVRTYAADANSVELRVSTAEVQLAIDRAVPLGLVFSELLSNALKHAFPGGKGGTIRVELQYASADTLTLTVADSGIGLNTGIAGRGDGASMGLRLVEMLIHQIRGELEVKSTNGSEFRVRFAMEGN